MASASKERILSRVREGLNKVDKINNPPADGEIYSQIDEDIVIAFAENFTKTAGKLIFCNKKEDYDILFALRSHGWLGGTRFYKRSMGRV